MRECLESKTLQLHFNRDVNYLASESDSMIRDVAYFLRAIVTRNQYAELLKVVPSRCGA